MQPVPASEEAHDKAVLFTSDIIALPKQEGKVGDIRGVSRVGAPVLGKISHTAISSIVPAVFR